jgi:hypothetical protein
MLRVRLGHDNVYATVDLSWADTAAIHHRLGELLKARQRLKRGVDRAKARAGVR